VADLLELVIERPVAGGRMLARRDGQVVLVAGAIPGERVRVRLERSSRKVLFAAVVDVIEASPDRRDPPCDPACGGSAYAFISPRRQAALKGEIVADAFARIGRLPVAGPVSVVESPEVGYRLRGRLHVDRGRVGFLLERSHRLCDARATGQFAQSALDAAEHVVGGLGDVQSDVGAILVAENVSGTERVLHLEPRDGRRLELPSVDEAALLAGGVTGVTMQTPRRPVIVAGNGRVTDASSDLGAGLLDIAPPVRWTRSALSFFQGNRFVIGRLLGRVLSHRWGSRILDLYAGVGLFSVPMAAAGAHVLAVEGDESSAADLVINAEPWTSLEVSHQSVEAALLRLTPGAFDTIVVDPPRTGASPGALEGIVALAAPRIVYVSCDPPTLARDAGRLRAAGYQLESVEAFDMFPNTPHVETVAVLQKV
jgi:23S rRNA (uracil1939-C5)-methyltransferase